MAAWPSVLISQSSAISKKMFLKDFQKELEERTARAASRGFTLEYQNKREQENNTICLKQLAPATLKKYEDTEKNWAL